MQCQEFEQLEQSFVDVRKERLEHVTKGTLTPDAEERLSRAELRALIALLDHRAQHGCHGGAAARLPASRSTGGIIGPY